MKHVDTPTCPRCRCEIRGDDGWHVDPAQELCDSCEEAEADDAAARRAELDEEDEGDIETECPYCDYGCSACSPLVGGEG